MQRWLSVLIVASGLLPASAFAACTGDSKPGGSCYTSDGAASYTNPVVTKKGPGEAGYIGGGGGGDVAPAGETYPAPARGAVGGAAAGKAGGAYISPGAYQGSPCATGPGAGAHDRLNLPPYCR